MSAIETSADSATADIEPSEAVSGVRRRYSRDVQILGMLGAATFIYLLRQPSVFTSPAFWAEDGTIFFKGAIEQGFGAVFEPYRGQLLLFQRLVAGLAVDLPVSLQPALYVAVATATAVLSCSIILSGRWRFPVSLNVRFICLVALLCSPTVDEVYGTLANAHWWLAIGLLLLGLLHDPTSRRVKWAEVAFTGVTALSGFAALYGIPTLVVRALRNRSRHSVLLLGIALSGAVVQVGYLLASPRGGNTAALVAHPLTELVALIRRVFAGAALGDTNLAILWPARLPSWWVWLIPIALITALTIVWILASRLEIEALILTLLGGSVVFLLSLEDPLAMLWSFAYGGRFLVVLTAVLYVSLIVWRSENELRRLATAVACILLAVGIMSDYHVTPLSAVPPPDWAPFAACVEQRTTSCSVVIPPGWTLEIGPRGP